MCKTCDKCDHSIIWFYSEEDKEEVECENHQPYFGSESAACYCPDYEATIQDYSPVF